MFEYNFQKRLVAATPFIALIIFFTMGFGFNQWGPGALAFLLVPAMPFLVGLKKINVTFPLVVVIAYLIMGFGFDLWHPGWVIFLTIPVYEILVPSRRVIVVTKKKTNKETIIDAE